jgi:hypothetical protein
LAADEYQLGRTATYKNSIFDSRFICMVRPDNARETWINLEQPFDLSPNDTKGFWWSAFIGP